LIASLDHEFALAILDVQNGPSMDGFTNLPNTCGVAEETRRLPIIFLSAVYSDDFHVFKGYEAGAVDFITKPYNSLPSLLSQSRDLSAARSAEKGAAEKIELERSKSLPGKHFVVHEPNRSWCSRGRRFIQTVKRRVHGAAPVPAG